MTFRRNVRPNDRLSDLELRNRIQSKTVREYLQNRILLNIIMVWPPGKNKRAFLAQ